MTDRILRRPEVKAQTGLSTSHIYDLMKRGQFPRPVKLSTRAVGWYAGEIADWIAGRAAERAGPEPLPQVAA